MKNSTTNQPLEICVLRLSAIGDVCHTLAVVQAIQRHYPQAKISWIIGKTEASLLQGIEGVEFIVFDKKSGWRGIWAVWQQLRHKRFDYLLNMQTAIRASVLSLGVKAKCKLGFDRARAREMQRLFVDKQVESAALPHVLDGQMMFAKAIGVTDLRAQWHLPNSAADLEYVRQWIDPTRKTVLIAPCSSKKEKDWRVENYAEICRYLTACNVRVLVAGSPSAYEMQSAATLKQAVPSVENIAGKTTLKQLAALISQVDLVLSSDSGPAHIATTQHTPVIGLYGVHNPQRTGPYADLDKVISVYDEAILAEYGKPWQQLPWATKVKDKNVMAKITPTQVKQKLLESLKLSV